jgi:hypothetical protein
VVASLFAELRVVRSNPARITGGSVLEKKWQFAYPGTDVMILKIFSPKNLAKFFAFFAETTVSF